MTLRSCLHKVPPALSGDVAHLVERGIRIAEVGRSSRLVSTIEYQADLLIIAIMGIKAEIIDVPTAWELPGWIPPAEHDELTRDEQAAVEKYSGQKLYDLLVRLNAAPARPQISE